MGIIIGFFIQDFNESGYWPKEIKVDLMFTYKLIILKKLTH